MQNSGKLQNKFVKVFYYSSALKCKDSVEKEVKDRKERVFAELHFQAIPHKFQRRGLGGQGFFFFGEGTRKSEQRLKLMMFLASGKWTPHFRIFSLELL